MVEYRRIVDKTVLMVKLDASGRELIVDWRIMAVIISQRVTSFVCHSSGSNGCVCLFSLLPFIHFDQKFSNFTNKATVWESESPTIDANPISVALQLLREWAFRSKYAFHFDLGRVCVCVQWIGNTICDQTVLLCECLRSFVYAILAKK